MKALLAALAIVLPAALFSLLLPVFASASAADKPQPQEQVVCTTRAAMLGGLAQRFNEVPRGRGITLSGEAMLEITVSPDGSTWSALISSPDGMTCLMTAGEDWQALTPPPVPTGRAM